MIPTVAQPSVQSLLLRMQYEDQILSYGTGFVATIGRGVALVTARHNATGRHQETGRPLSTTGGLPNRLVVLHNRKNHEGKPFETTFSLLGEESRPKWCEHPVLGAHADFVALPLVAKIDLPLYTYDPGNPGLDLLVGPAEPVSVIGFPFGLSPTGPHAVWATGFVATEPILDYNGLPVFLIDCRTRQGQSGSPVIAYRTAGIARLQNGRVFSHTDPGYRFLGIYSGRIRDDSDIGMVWKASAIDELLRAMASAAESPE